jgi:hypothetical protein
VNVALVAPAATATLGGTSAIAGSLLESATATPPPGAAPLRTTVSIEEAPAVTLVGLRLTDDNVGGVTVRTALRVTPPWVPEIVTAVDAGTGVVEIVNVALVAPAGTLTLAETIAVARMLLDSATATPPTGAGALRVAVPVAAVPPVTPLGLTLREERLGARITVRVASWVVPPYVAEIVTPMDAATKLVDTVNVALVAPAASITLLGTVAAAGSLLASRTTAALASAGPINVTVPIEEVPASTLVGLRINDDRVVDGATVAQV